MLIEKMKTQDIIFDIIDSFEIGDLTKIESTDAIMKVIEECGGFILPLINLNYPLSSHPVQNPYVVIKLTKMTEGIFNFTGKINLIRMEGEGFLGFKSMQFGDTVLTQIHFMSYGGSSENIVDSPIKVSIKKGDKFKFTPIIGMRKNKDGEFKEDPKFIPYKVNKITLYPSEIEN